MRPFPNLPHQLDLATRTQLDAAGWTRSARANLVAQHGTSPFPGVYRQGRSPLNVDELVMAAALWAGPRALLTGGHALRMFGLDAPAPAVVRFLIPSASDRRTQQGAELVRTNRWPRIRVGGGLHFACLERALADAGRYHDYPDQALTALTITALQRRLTTPERLADELNTGRRNDTFAVRAGLTEFEAGAWSIAEALLRKHLSRRPWRFWLNPLLVTSAGDRIGRPDAYLPDSGLAIQVHSKRYHSGFRGGVDLWSRTVERDSVFVTHGIPVLPVTPAALRDRDHFLAQVEAIVRARVNLPLPDAHRATELPRRS